MTKEHREFTEEFNDLLERKINAAEKVIADAYHPSGGEYSYQLIAFMSATLELDRALLTHYQEAPTQDANLNELQEKGALESDNPAAPQPRKSRRHWMRNETPKQSIERVGAALFASIWLCVAVTTVSVHDARDIILDAVKPQPPIYKIEIHGKEIDVPRDARVLLEHWQRGEEGYKVTEVRQ